MRSGSTFKFLFSVARERKTLRISNTPKHGIPEPESNAVCPQRRLQFHVQGESFLASGNVGVLLLEGFLKPGRGVRASGKKKKDVQSGRLIQNRGRAVHTDHSRFGPLNPRQRR
jgi:hypothetical protein